MDKRELMIDELKDLIKFGKCIGNTPEEFFQHMQGYTGELSFVLSAFGVLEHAEEIIKLLENLQIQIDKQKQALRLIVEVHDDGISGSKMQKFIDWHNGCVEDETMELTAGTQDGFVCRELARAVLEGEYF